MYHKQDIYNIVGIDCSSSERKKIVYCCVSSKKQMDDLERQKDFLQSKYPHHIMVTDIGSGINWKRKGLKTILEQTMRGAVEEVVVAHKDRLCRFGFELIEFIFSSNKTKLVVLNRDDNESPDTELTEDIISIIHVYSCRNMGRRRYSSKKNKDLSQCESNESTETMDKHNSVCV